MKCRWVSRSCRTENPRIFPEKGVDMPGKENRFSYLQQASVAQLVEHHLAKVDVESSNLFARSILFQPRRCGVFVAKVGQRLMETTLFNACRQLR